MIPALVETQNTTKPTLAIVQQERLAQLFRHRIGVLLHLYEAPRKAGERLEIELAVALRVHLVDGVDERLLVQPMAEHLQNGADVLGGDLLALVSERVERVLEDCARM